MCAKEAARLQAEDLLKLRAEIATMAEIQEQSRDDQAHLQDTLQDTTADLHELQVWRKISMLVVTQLLDGCPCRSRDVV